MRGAAWLRALVGPLLLVVRRRVAQGARASAGRRGASMAGPKLAAGGVMCASTGAALSTESSLPRRSVVSSTPGQMWEGPTAGATTRRRGSRCWTGSPRTTWAFLAWRASHSTRAIRGGSICSWGPATSATARRRFCAPKTTVRLSSRPTCPPYGGRTVTGWGGKAGRSWPWIPTTPTSCSAGAAPPDCSRARMPDSPGPMSARSGLRPGPT